MTSAVCTTGLSKHFGVVRALEHVTLEIPRGVVFGLLGPNGSGKTTLIRLLLGLLRPNAGTAEVLGRSTQTHASDIRERCGALLEHSGLYERLSAADNLDLYGRFWRLSAGARRARTKELLTDLALWDRRGEIVAGWSRGMKQKLAIARALLHRPELLFLDEPTAGLDPVAALALRDQLKNLAATEGVTIFLSTHNLAEAERLCGLVGVVHHGRLLALAPPRELSVSTRADSLEDAFQSLVEVRS
jgi:ABC-2 type transport system ATP-binding protein